MKTSVLASVLLVLMVATAVSAAKPVTHAITWSIPPTVKNARVKILNVCVGDTLVFSWRGQHGLAVLPTGICPKRGTAPAVAWPAKNIIAPSSTKGSKSIKVAKAGRVVYSCQVSSHCLSGQALQVIAKAC